jgi:hypothetical protein
MVSKLALIALVPVCYCAEREQFGCTRTRVPIHIYAPGLELVILGDARDAIKAFARCQRSIRSLLASASRRVRLWRSWRARCRLRLLSMPADSDNAW